ncbi:MAG TPA: hypothetical protein VJ998_06035, partial [Pseudomonadales bacterium]|nr:hypothetical protein [Pseudomonadales bacterium]
RIQPGVPLIQVADYNELEVRAPIPADTGYALRERMHEGARVAAMAMVDGQKIDFVLNRLSGDVKSGQSGLDAFFSASGKSSLDIGRVVNLKVTLPVEDDVVALPIQAIYEGNKVYKVIGDRLVGVDVDPVGDYTDAHSKYRILVRSSKIKAGDSLITTQLPRAISGLLVDPIDASKFDEAIASGPAQSDSGG